MINNMYSVETDEGIVLVVANRVQQALSNYVQAWQSNGNIEAMKSDKLIIIKLGNTFEVVSDKKSEKGYYFSIRQNGR